MSPRQAPRPVLPGPPCFWRYLLIWCAAAPLWLVPAFVTVVVQRERPRMGTALVYFTLAYACLAWMLEEAYVWWKDKQGTATYDDYPDATTKKVQLGVIALGGLGLLAGLMRLMVVWAGAAPTNPADPPAAPTPAPAPAPSVAPTPQPAPAPAPPTPFDPTAPLSAGNVPAAPQFPGLLAYWSFDVGEKADYRRTGCREVPGARNGALWITGPQNHVELGANPALNFAAGAPFTVCAWVRTTTDGVVLSFRNAAEQGAVVMVSVEGGKAVWLVRGDRGEIGPPAVATGTPVADGRWHHLAGVRHADSTVELYVDGVPAAGSHVRIGGPITTDLRFLGHEELRIRVNYPGLTTWTGVIDEVAVFGRRLAPDKIAALAGRR